jgi:spore coat polysaccharide biosynthesis protein SpsF (cytidylyltransferase family)
MTPQRKVVAIVQARWASTRLPGKTLRRFAGATILAHVLNRCKAIRQADFVCCAVPDEHSSDVVAEEAIGAGVDVVRGPEQDVLARYMEAARATGADIILRVTSDCPLIDPVLCGRVIDLLLRENADHVCNNAPPSWPHGLDCAAFTRRALALACAEAREPYEREHVTPWIRLNPSFRRLNLRNGARDQAKIRWTVDYPEDLAFFQALERFIRPFPSIENREMLLALMTEDPELRAINAMHEVAERGDDEGHEQVDAGQMG